MPYVTMPRGWLDHEDGWQSSQPTIHVHEDCPSPKPAGLLDHTGEMIYRVPETVVMGFVGRVTR